MISDAHFITGAINADAIAGLIRTDRHMFERYRVSNHRPCVRTFERRYSVQSSRFQSMRPPQNPPQYMRAYWMNDAMERLPFRALWTNEPWGVLSFDLTEGFQLWRARDWLRHRGGMRVHYADLAATRTIVVDHLEFSPNGLPGLGYDALDRRFGRITLAMAFGIAFSRDEGVDEAYLRRCFERDDAQRIMNALGTLASVIRREPLLPSEATADVNAAIVGRSDDVLVIR